MRELRSPAVAALVATLLAGCSAAPGAGPTTEPAATSPATTSTPATTVPGTTTSTIHPTTILPAGSGVTILDIRPHDAEAFTQGMVTVDGILYESTGRYGTSGVRRVDPSTGAVLAETPLSDDLFGEGLAAVGDRLIQLTWQENTAIVWDAATLTEIERFSYAGEGWGLCHDGDRLVMSNGSATLTFRDPATFAVLGSVAVRGSGGPVERLNELECRGGAVLANVWQEDRIVVIDPADGSVLHDLDLGRLRELLPEVAADPADVAGAEVLNGIAADPLGDGLLLTGKFWPVTFVVDLGDADPAARP